MRQGRRTDLRDRLSLWKDSLREFLSRLPSFELSDRSLTPSVLAHSPLQSVGNVESKKYASNGIWVDSGGKGRKQRRKFASSGPFTILLAMTEVDQTLLCLYPHNHA